MDKREVFVIIYEGQVLGVVSSQKAADVIVKQKSELINEDGKPIFDPSKFKISRICF